MSLLPTIPRAVLAMGARAAELGVAPASWAREKSVPGASSIAGVSFPIHDTARFSDMARQCAEKSEKTLEFWEDIHLGIGTYHPTSIACSTC